MLGLILFVFFAVILVNNEPTDPAGNLLESSYAVFMTNAHAQFDSYKLHWISNTEAVYLSSGRRAQEAVRLDIRTQTLTKIPELTSRLTDGFATETIAGDGQSLLIWRVPGVATAYRMDGKRQGIWSVPYMIQGGTPAVALRDQARWICMDTQGQANLLDPASSDPKRLPGLLGNEGLVGLDYEGNLVTQRFADLGLGKIGIRIYRIQNDSLALKHEYTLPTMKNVRMEQVVLSPSGTRLLSIRVSGGNHIFPAWLRSLFPSLGYRQTRELRSLWTSNLDFSNPHELGTVHPEWDSGPPLEPAWLPDGKAVSFQRDHRVWIVPAP